MRIILAAGPVVLATLVFNASASACDDDRYLCEPKPIVKPVEPAASAQPQNIAPKPARPERKTAARKTPPPPNDAEKAPPDPPRLQAKPAPLASWKAIDVPSAAVEPLDGRDAFAMGDVEVVSPDELNEIDMAALPAPDPVKIVPIRVVSPEPPAEPAPQRVDTARPEPLPVDTSLLERVLVTFGGAFGAASALRIFIG
jgi:hypothetical protein